MLCADHADETEKTATTHGSAQDMDAFSRRRRGRRSVAGAHCTDDESPGRGADEVEGITSDQRERACRRRVQHRDVVRVDHPRSLDAIDVLPLQRVELDHVARDDVLQSPEETVPVPGDARVSVGPRRAVPSM